MSVYSTYIEVFSGSPKPVRVIVRVKTDRRRILVLSILAKPKLVSSIETVLHRSIHHIGIEYEVHSCELIFFGLRHICTSGLAVNSVFW